MYNFPCMINGRKVLALIPARGGSKGIKNKNIVSLCGKPLIWYTINVALKSEYIDSVVVSTDSNAIREVSLKYGARVPFIRPKKLATDSAKTIDVVVHAIEKLAKMGEKYDVLILLQPTQPLRNLEDVNGALEFFVRRKDKSVVSVTEVENHPLLIRTIRNGQLKRLFDRRSDIRRQNMKKYFYVNGAVYINKISEINGKTSFNDNKMAFIMPSIRTVDIDDSFDLVIAENILKFSIK